MPRPFGRQGGPAGGRSPQSGRADIDAAIRKLKEGYRDYAAVYGERIFNLRGFENRYRQALVGRVNLAVFARAEIAVFQELKRKVEGKPAPPPAPGRKPDRPGKEKSYSEIADRIIEENLRRIRKYRPIDFHPDAEEETRHLLGAVTDFYYEVWGDIQRLLKPYNLRRINESMDRLENEFCSFVVPVRGSHSRVVEDYALVLQRRNPAESERASYAFLKKGGILLNNCLQLVNQGLNFLATNTSLSSQMSRLEAHKQRLARIIGDFRLADIRQF
jgi:hypothetical protein